MKVSNEVVNAKEKQKINKVKVTEQQDIAPKPDFPNILDVQEEFKEWKRKGFLWQKRRLPEGIEVGSNISLSYARIEDLTQDAQGSKGYVYIAMQEPSVGFVVKESQPLFVDLISEHPGLAEELAEVDKTHKFE